MAVILRSLHVHYVLSIVLFQTIPFWKIPNCPNMLTVKISLPWFQRRTVKQVSALSQTSPLYEQMQKVSFAVSCRGNLPEISKPLLWEKWEKYFKLPYTVILLSMLNVRDTVEFFMLDVVYIRLFSEFECTDFLKLLLLTLLSSLILFRGNRRERN